MSQFDPDAFESTDRPYADRRVLSELYVYRGLSQVEIADRLGCADCTVSEYRREYGIVRRYMDPEYLRKKYHGEGMTLAEVANKIGCDLSTVETHMEKNGISRRTISESRAKGDITPLHDEDWLRREYEDKGRNTTDISEELGVTTWAVSIWLRRHGIETRPSLSATGEDNPNWSGGYKKYYGRNWEEQREKAIERDGGKCHICGDPEIQVHHVHPFRTFGLENYEEANRLENLICLCQEHHSQWEGITLRPQ